MTDADFVEAITDHAISLTYCRKVSLWLAVAIPPHPAFPGETMASTGTSPKDAVVALLRFMAEPGPDVEANPFLEFIGS